MKSKKIIASLMALSIIGSSSFVLGGTAKASTLNNTSNKIGVSAWANYNLHTQVNLHGYIYWCKIAGATKYKFEVKYIEYNQSVLGGSGDESYLEEDISNCRAFQRNMLGKYSVTVKALDSNENVITQETIYFYYDGVETNQL